MMRHCCVIWVILCLSTGSGFASDRSHALVNSFLVMCTLEPLDFAKSEGKAAAMRLPVKQDLQPAPDTSGSVVRSKSWLMPLKTGSHEFSVAEARGPKGEVKSCGIAAADAVSADVRTDLTKTMKLTSPISDVAAKDGIHRTTTWLYGGLKLQLTDRSPRSLPGIYLFLVQSPLER